MATFRELKISWKELGEMLSKARVLMWDEDIDHITLTKPRQLLIRTHARRVKEKEPKVEQANEKSVEQG